MGILLQAANSARGEVISLCQLRDNTGRIPLSWAIEYGNTDVFDSLVAADPNSINLADYSNRTMLSWALSGGHQKMLEHLFDKGYGTSGWDVTDRLGNKPFHWAIKSGNLRPFIKFLSLMLKRVDVGEALENPDQEDIFRSYRANLQSLSREAAAEEDARLFTAIRHGRSKDVKEALRHRVAPFADIDEQKQSPMDLAIELDNKIAALTMIASGRMDERTLATLKAAKPHWLKGERVLSILHPYYRPHRQFNFSESCRNRN
jgi:ankyrin repeat protein